MLSFLLEEAYGPVVGGSDRDGNTGGDSTRHRHAQSLTLS